MIVFGEPAGDRNKVTKDGMLKMTCERDLCLLVGGEKADGGRGAVPRVITCPPPRHLFN